MYVDTYYRAMQTKYAATQSSAAKSTEEPDSAKAAVDDDSVNISQEAKDLAEKNTYENRIRELFSNTPGSLDDVEKELESLKDQFSESIQKAKRDYGIAGSLSYPKFTAFDGTTPPLSLPGIPVFVSRGMESTYVNSEGETVTAVENFEYESNKKNHIKFNKAIDKDLFGKIAAYSTILNKAQSDSNFANLYNQDPAKAIAGAYSELYDKIGYFKPEGQVSSLQFVFTDER